MIPFSGFIRLFWNKNNDGRLKEVMGVMEEKMKSCDNKIKPNELKFWYVGIKKAEKDERMEERSGSHGEAERCTVEELLCGIGERKKTWRKLSEDDRTSIPFPRFIRWSWKKFTHSKLDEFFELSGEKMKSCDTEIKSTEAKFPAWAFDTTFTVPLPSGTTSGTTSSNPLTVDSD